MYKINNFFDDLIDELSTNSITTVYGPPGVGKSTLCFQYAISCAKLGKKVIFIDTEGGFSVERIRQIDDEVDLENLIVLSPRSFDEQQKSIMGLNKYFDGKNKIGLIIIDSLVMLYRLKLGDSPQKVNSDLGEQLRLLTEISRIFGIPLLVTNQMYTTFDSKDKRMVGGSLIEYWSKTIVELDRSDDDKKIAKLIKHKYKKEGEKIYYDIDNSGLTQILD